MLPQAQPLSPETVEPCTSILRVIVQCDRTKVFIAAQQVQKNVVNFKAPRSIWRDDEGGISGAVTKPP
jgi:hypothetical protein